MFPLCLCGGSYLLTLMTAKYYLQSLSGVLLCGDFSML